MLKNYLSLIKFSHTIFALPFALIGFTLAVSKPEHAFTWDKLLFVLLCMILPAVLPWPSTGILIETLILQIPELLKLEIPNGTIKERSALQFVIVNCVLFMGTAYLLNSLCFILSPISLLVILGYSYTKRFTALCHLVLGLGLSLSPIGAYLAVTAQFNIIPLLFSCIILFWVSGFDIIYALQDENFDKEFNLHSIPVLLGQKNALRFSRLMHIITAAIILFIGINYFATSTLFWTATTLFIGLLINQHRLVKPDDLSKINLAFFTNNGIASLIFGSLIVIELITNN